MHIPGNRILMSLSFPLLDKFPDEIGCRGLIGILKIFPHCVSIISEPLRKLLVHCFCKGTVCLTRDFASFNGD